MDSEKTKEIFARIKEYKNSFIKYNELKKNKLITALADPALVNLFNYIPFLLTVNHPEFPGYLKQGTTLLGIWDYQPSDELERYIRAKHPSYTSGKPLQAPPFIHMLALIGSAGSVAFTSESDFDYWICCNTKSAEPKELALFREKCHMIEDWVMENHSKEIHFFINDIEQIRKNIFDEDEEYGLGGTSLGQLLKEEFFRSSIVISGKIPFWWVVPTDTDDRQYLEWLSTVKGTPLDNDFIDLGNLAKINKGDFLIAALFQIIKSLGNPFKSIIKLGLLERYIHDEHDNPFVSNIIKRNIQAGKNDPESIDAYLIMFNQVYDYYMSGEPDMTSINIIKTCFYLKVDPKLSDPVKKAGGDEKSAKMIEYTKKWGWDSGIVRHIDNFESWEIDSVNQLMNNTKKSILKGYKNILTVLDMAKVANTIDQKSMMIINRKVLSHFQLEENKIDNTLSFKSFPAEKLLLLEFVRDKRGTEAWFLYKRLIDSNNPVKVLIRKSKNLFVHIVWISLNGLLQKNFTRLEIGQGLYQMDPNFIRDLIVDLSSHFSIKKLDLHNSYFFRDVFPVMSYIIINPFSKYSKKIDDIYFLYHNSWGETRFEVYHSEVDLAQIIVRVVNGALVSGNDFSSALQIVSSQPFQSSKEFFQLKVSIRSIFTFFTENHPEVKSRYLSKLGNQFMIFSNSLKKRNEAVVSVKPCETEIKMLYSMAYNRGSKNLVKADETVPELNHIREITKYRADDSIQIFFQTGQKYCYYFVQNERGSIVFFRKKSEFAMDYLASLISFAESAVNEVIEHNPGSTLADAEKKIKVYRLERDASNRCSFTEFAFENDRVLAAARKKYITTTLSLHLLENGDVGYRFTLPDGGFSEVYSKHDFEKISCEISTIMDSIREYKYYISAVNLEFVEIKMYMNYTSFSFSEKNRFELMIEKCLGLT